ncbi:MAG: MarR family winged helix-turn-helix transcriptional regulator [Rhodospirillaceae bacterium]
MKSGAHTKADLVPLIVADVFELAGAFRAHGDRIAATVGQTQARWQVLSAASDAPRTVPQIARRLGVTRQGVQRLADALVADGAAAYRPNPDHRGSPHLVLTEPGRTALARLTEAAGRYHAAVAAPLDAETLRAVRDGLRRLIGTLDRLGPRLVEHATKE